MTKAQEESLFTQAEKLFAISNRIQSFIVNQSIANLTTDQLQLIIDVMEDANTIGHDIIKTTF